MHVVIEITAAELGIKSHHAFLLLLLYCRLINIIEQCNTPRKSLELLQVDDLFHLLELAEVLLTVQLHHVLLDLQVWYLLLLHLLHHPVRLVVRLLAQQLFAFSLHVLTSGFHWHALLLFFLLYQWGRGAVRELALQLLLIHAADLLQISFGGTHCQPHLLFGILLLERLVVGFEGVIVVDL